MCLYVSGGMCLCVRGRGGAFVFVVEGCVVVVYVNIVAYVRVVCV